MKLLTRKSRPDAEAVPLLATGSLLGGQVYLTFPSPIWPVRKRALWELPLPPVPAGTKEKVPRQGAGSDSFNSQTLLESPQTWEQEVSPSQPDSPRSSCFFEALLCYSQGHKTQHRAASKQPRKLLNQAQGGVGMSHFLVYQNLQGTVPIGSSGFWFSFEHVAM